MLHAEDHKEKGIFHRTCVKTAGFDRLEHSTGTPAQWPTPFTEPGRRVGLSAPAVMERIRRMEEADIIKGYRAEMNNQKIGYPILAFVRNCGRQSLPLGLNFKRISQRTVQITPVNSLLVSGKNIGSNDPFRVRLLAQEKT